MTETEIAYRAAINVLRAIVPPGGPGVELATLADAARFVALLRPFSPSATALEFCSRVASEGRRDRKRRDVEAATSQMERALRVEGSL
jgi:hypothetical protein